MNVLKWCERAEPGERMVYFRGVCLEEGPVQQAALQASEAGLVFLAQRRQKKGESIFDYEAIRISIPTARRLGLLPAPSGTIGRGRL